ncbi:MAG: hypothetical protein QMD21_07100 [Candidatus Thermoplasmatota archaeon]|nr:hypothetical protein [Candidatus Thermoplasmatota archaeon]
MPKKFFVILNVSTDTVVAFELRSAGDRFFSATLRVREFWNKFADNVQQ